MSNESNRVAEDKVLREYFNILNDGMIPNVQEIKNKTKYTMEIECADLVYGKEFVENITEEVVHNTLSIYKHVHHYDGKKYFECQNMLFAEWFEYQKILLLT